MKSTWREKESDSDSNSSTTKRYVSFFNNLIYALHFGNDSSLFCFLNCMYTILFSLFVNWPNSIDFFVYFLFIHSPINELIQ